MSAVLDAFLRVLNDGLAADGAAMNDLFAERVSANQALADHPTIQIGENDPGQFTLGTLGLINGLVEAATGARIAACYDESGQLTGFVRYEGPS